MHVANQIDAIFPCLLQTFRHGFPHSPTALSYDPVQKLLAIGDKSGSLRMYPFQIYYTQPSNNKHQNTNCLHTYLDMYVSIYTCTFLWILFSPFISYSTRFKYLPSLQRDCNVDKFYFS